MTAFSKLTQSVNGDVRIVDQSPLIVPIEQLAAGHERDEMFEGLHQLLRRYRDTLEFDRRVLLEQFELVDFARKVVGVGSVGTRAWIALMLGRDGQDPLFLQMKEAEASVLEEILGPSEFANHGERVVTGQRLMQATSDIFLGWLHVDSGLDGQPRDFYGRQLKDWKGSAEIEQMVPKGMATYGTLCGWTLARAHARSGDRIAIAAYLGNGDSFDRAILEFSKAYAEQNERDYQAARGGSQVRTDHRPGGSVMCARCWANPLPVGDSDVLGSGSGASAGRGLHWAQVHPLMPATIAPSSRTKIANSQTSTLAPPSPIARGLTPRDESAFQGIRCHPVSGSWGDCCEQSLWVHRSLRGRGLATRLIAAAETEAAMRGCSDRSVTYDFQARGHDSRGPNGYELVGRVENFPSGTDALWYARS